MHTFRRYYLWLPVFVIVYASISGGVLIARWHDNINELYPFAPWTLFCFTPNEEVEYDIRIVELDGQPLPEPRFFQQYVTLPDASKITAYGIIQEMGFLAASDNQTGVQKQQQLFAANFWQPTYQRVRYELVRRRYDVLERKQSGYVREMETIGQFEYKSGDPGS